MKNRQEIIRRAKAIQHTFSDRSMFKALRYTLKHWY